MRTSIDYNIGEYVTVRRYVICKKTKKAKAAAPRSYEYEYEYRSDYLQLRIEGDGQPIHRVVKADTTTRTDKADTVVMPLPNADCPICIDTVLPYIRVLLLDSYRVV